VPITADNLPDDLAPLKQIITTMALDALTAQAEIARLKFQLARYRRAEFGRSSEKLAREVEQLELALEALETDQAERLMMASPAVAAAVETAAEARSRRGDHCRSTCPERSSGIPHRAVVPVAAARCARSPTRSARPWIMSRAASK
jgi:Transposase C of IS166 homeodomain